MCTVLRYQRYGVGQRYPRLMVSIGSDGNAAFLLTDSGREERVDSRTGQAEWRIGGAQTVELKNKVEDSCADKARDKGRPHLSDERVSRRNLDVVGELEVVGEVDSIGRGDVSVHFEVVHSCGQSRILDKGGRWNSSED